MKRKLDYILPRFASGVFTFPKQPKQWRLVAFQFGFTTDATVANRFPTFLWRGPENTLATFAGEQLTAASLTHVYNFMAGLVKSYQKTISLTVHNMEPLPEMVVDQNTQLEVQISGWVAGDSMGADAMAVIEYLED